MPYKYASDIWRKKYESSFRQEYDSSPEKKAPPPKEAPKDNEKYKKKYAVSDKLEFATISTVMPESSVMPEIVSPPDQQLLKNEFLVDPPNISAEFMNDSFDKLKHMVADPKPAQQGAHVVNQEILVYYPRISDDQKDYDDQTVTLGALHYINVRDLLARFFLHSHYSFGKLNNWRNMCIGISSWASTGRVNNHMPMFDYDGRNIKTLIRKDVKRLQKEYDLGPAWVYGTKRGFHVYFFTDAVEESVYFEMLDKIQCCKGFKSAAKKRGYGVLRISAKYTQFDIELDKIIPARSKRLRRKLRKAHLVEALIDMGQECGTHLASLFPQWCGFQEDPKPWKPRSKKSGKGQSPLKDGGLKAGIGTHEGVPAFSIKSNCNVAVDGNTITISSPKTYTTGTSFWGTISTNNSTG
jgi:hypothetical protein